jgi:hypothetical protein
MTMVVALEFFRSPQWFLDCIVCGEALDKHRSAMLAVGRPCIFGGEGAKMLVSPEVVNDVLLHLSSAGVTFEDIHYSWDELRPRHMIVSESLEIEVMAAIAACTGSGQDGGRAKENKVRVKRRVVIEVPPGAWHEEVDPGFDTTKWLYSFSV